LSLRLMIALTMLKNSFNCSDEDLVQRFADSVTWQLVLTLYSSTAGMFKLPIVSP